MTTYDPDHNYAPKAVYLPTGSGRELQSLSAYDVRHRLISITHQLCVLADVNAHTCTSTTAAGSDTYAYDNNDSRTRVTEANGAAASDRFYCYDARDQLTYRNTGTACSSSVKDEAYAYDDAGNRTSALVAGSTRTFTYTPDGQLTSCLSPACTITYDSTGRTSAWTEHDVPTNTDITWSYTYDSAGRLTSACKASSCAGTGFDRLDFTYDGEGHRTRIVETPMAGTPVVTRDLRYQADAVVEESVNNVIIRSVIVDDAGAPTKLVVTNSGTANGTYLPTWNGHGDLLALWRTEADGTLTLAASVTYDTWGKPNVTTANGIGDLGFSRLYVGRSDVWWDNAYGAGLLYMHARTYSPTLGRFLQPDPIAAEGNLYAYAGNSPVTKADPSGRFWYKVGARDHTVAQLAARFHVSVASMYRFNSPYITRNRPYLHPGMCLWIWQPEKLGGTRSPSFDTGSCSGWTTSGFTNARAGRGVGAREPQGSGRRSVDFGVCNPGLFMGGVIGEIYGAAQVAIGVTAGIASGGFGTLVVLVPIAEGMTAVAAGSVAINSSNSCGPGIR